MRVQCPNCKMDTALYEIVEGTGWREVNADGTSGRRVEEMGYDGVTSTGEIGCGNCDWTGYRPHPTADFERLGIDDKPLPAVHPLQTTLAEVLSDNG